MRQTPARRHSCEPPAHAATRGNAVDSKDSRAAMGNVPCCNDRPRSGAGQLDPQWRPPLSPARRPSTWALDGLPPAEVSNARSLAAAILADAKRGQRDRIEKLLDAEGLTFEQTRMLLGATDLANGNTALMLATRNGHASTCQLLLERGADPNARNRDGLTATDLAAAEYQDVHVKEQPSAPSSAELSVLHE